MAGGEGAGNALGRPRGEERTALLEAARWFAAQRLQDPLHDEQGQALIGATWPELMQRALLAWDAGRSVLDNAVRAGELVPQGRTVVVGFARPLTVYAPAPDAAPRWAGAFDDVSDAFAAMCRQHG